MADPKPCKRCKAPDATLTLRQAPSCSACFTQFVESKVTKRMATIRRETRTNKFPDPTRYVVGLSLGSSSAALACILDSQARYFANKNTSAVFDILVVHVDTDLDRDESQQDHILEEFKKTCPNIKFERIPLTAVLDVHTVDWTTLPLPPAAAAAAAADDDDQTPSPAQRLRSLFDNLPTLTARTDVVRHLIRHLLLHIATTRSYNALLFGQTTTALAALTLSEVANGRGFAVPWQVSDGPYTLSTYPTPAGEDQTSCQTEYPVYYPLREIFRVEATTYVSQVASKLASSLPEESRSSTVVSHKDTSIEEVMTRYFDDVEGPYSGIVANVVRTTGKLTRQRGSALCGLCGVTLDEQGDERWAGEMASESGDGGQRLCYGCRRTVKGQ